MRSAAALPDALLGRLVELPELRAASDAEELHQTSRSVSGRLTTAADLVVRFPATLAAMERGELTLAHARALSDVTYGVSPLTAARVEKRVLERATGKTPAQVRDCARRAVNSWEPVPPEPALDPRDDRCIGVTPLPGGMADLHARVRAEDAAHIMNQVDQCATATKGMDDRTADQRRADAFVDLVRGDATRPRSGPTTNVVVSLSTLLGLDDQAAELARHGYIPPSLAWAIANDPTGTWRRILTDDQGRVLAVSKKYRPPKTMRRLVRARDRTCRFPSCRAGIAEIDHIEPWPDGPTTPSNLQGLCLRHHHLKHEAGWSVERLPSGVSRWTTPTGPVIDKPPDDLPLDITMQVFDPPPF